MYKLEKNGFVIKKNSFDHHNQKKLLSSFYKICKFFAPKYFKKSKVYSWGSRSLNDGLIKLRKNNPLLFSVIYDSTLRSQSLNSFIFNSEFENIAKKILKINKEEICMHGAMLRIDCPYDTRNTYDWHQDSAYDKLNTNPMNGSVVWSPLVNTNKKNGALILMPGSHKEKTVFYKPEKLGKNKSIKSRQILVPEKMLKKYKSKQVSLEAGNSIVCYSNLFHKSGYNDSDKIRFTVLVRYNKITSKDFLYYRNKILKIK